MADQRPIGLLDSGVGGLSVLREIRQYLPGESILYVADQGHIPYGPRPEEEIRCFVMGIARFLLDHNCKMIVVACNAANAAALHPLREAFPDVPIVGMEPAIKPAVEATKTGVIGVITTAATFQGKLFSSVIDRFAKGIRVETQVCPDLVLLVEQGAPHTPESQAAIARYLAPLQVAHIDQLVLGCTHFPFLNDQLQAQLGPDVAIIDPAPAVARQTGRILEQHSLQADPFGTASVRYFTSGDAANCKRLIEQLIGDTPAQVQALCWADDVLLASQDTTVDPHAIT